MTAQQASLTVAGCGAPDQAAALPASVDLTKETVIAGTVTADGATVSGAYVRLLDGTGEFTAEVVASDDGAFRFFAAPGAWTVRALSRAGNGDVPGTADRGLNEGEVAVAR
jgi:hypothetical protein